MYPPARRSDHVDTYFNTPVPDPYRWMEDVDAPEVEAWVTAQNTLTRSVLDAVPGRRALHDRLLALTNFERVSAPTVRNGRFVFARNTGLQNQAVLFWQNGPDGEPHLLLDPNTLSPDGTVALAGISVSHTGTHLAYALSEAGSDWITWHVREIGTGPDGSSPDLPDHIIRSKFSSASWLPDTSGFLYSGYGLPEALTTEALTQEEAAPTTKALTQEEAVISTEAQRSGEIPSSPSPDAPAQPPTTPEPPATPHDLKAAQHFHKVFRHTLGTPQSVDPVLYHRRDDGELLLGGSITDDGRFLLLTASKGHTNQLHAFALDTSFQPIGNLLPIAPIADARYDPIDTDGDTLWLHTTSDAPNGRVVALNLTAPTRETWHTILPEITDNLDSVSMVADTLIATYLADAQSEVHLFSPTGQPLGPLTLPAIGTVSPFSGRRTDTESFVTFTNFTTPPTILHLDLNTARAAAPKAPAPPNDAVISTKLPNHAVISTEAQRSGEIPSVKKALTPFRAPALTFNPADFITTQVFLTSKDGTGVPMFLTHKRGLALDGTNPTLLYAYGGFNISLLPTFSPSYLLWMELGGIFAQPNLRGGGEFGEAWHEAGTRLKKQNVFDDFIAAAEFLISNRYTSPAKLAIEGGSNGGLLVAAVELQRPDLFAAAVAHVGVFDMLRFPQFTIGYAWKPDYGDPSGNEAEFHALLRYSPLHNTRPGVPYPPTLVLTADHDDRVFPAHSFKFTAAIQHALTPTQTGDPALPTPQTALISTEAQRTGETSASPPLSPDPAQNPTLIRVEVRAGHGAGMPLSKRIDQTVDVFLFLTRFLHLPSPAPAK